jgi:hypothetical protein
MLLEELGITLGARLSPMRRKMTKTPRNSMYGRRRQFFERFSATIVKKLMRKCPGVCLLFLAAPLCAGQTPPRPDIIRTVAPETKHDRKLEEAIQREIGESSYTYAYNRVKLHNGEASEALVYMPGADFCGSGGCTCFIFAARGGEYRLVSRLSLTRPPIVVSSHRTNGWSDLVVFVSGGGIQPGYYAVLPFDGAKYPDNPTVNPAAPLKERVGGVAYLAGADSPKFDIVVTPQ